MIDFYSLPPGTILTGVNPFYDYKFLELKDGILRMQPILKDSPTAKCRERKFNASSPDLLRKFKIKE